MRSASTRSAASSGSRTSAAPRTHSPRPSNVAPPHLRAEENGTVAVRVQPGSGQPSATAARLALGRGSAAPSAPSASRTSGPSGRTSASRIPFSVSVPVLSAQTTSTRASPSIAGSSCTRHCRAPSRTTPTANAMLVSSTSPSGTIGTSAATMPRSASSTSAPAVRNWLQMMRTAAGTSSQVMTRRIVSMPERSSEPTRVKRLASSASCAA